MSEKAPRNHVRILLFLPTHLSANHYACLRCWPYMLARTQLMRQADVLVYGGAIGVNKSLIQLWKSTLRRTLPNPNVTFMQYAPRYPGKQRGAMEPVAIAHTNGWFAGYDWVVRLNPDVLTLDERPLARLIQLNVSGIFANCCSDANCSNRPIQVSGAAHDHLKLANQIQADLLGEALPLVHTDFFAFRPAAVASNFFADHSQWEIAEYHATSAFRNMIQARTGSATWLVPYKRERRGGCRILGGGIAHAEADTSASIRARTRRGQLHTLFCAQPALCEKSWANATTLEAFLQEWSQKQDQVLV